MVLMKAGLITFHYAHHYGAQLQAFALMQAIIGMGIDCEIINYVRKDTIEGSSLFRKELTARAVLSNVNTLLNYRKLKKRHDRFQNFVNKDMRLSDRFYGSYEDLLADPPEYDIYVCGSDQIWNPLIYKEKTFDPAFFAEFARSGKRVAYAPSFGIDKIPKDKRDELKRYLSRFECLSSREEQGERIIREISGKEAVTVLDPTLLLNGIEWSAFSVDSEIKDPYLLCYFITDGRKYSDYVSALSEKLNLPVVSLCGSRRVVSCTRRTVLDAGPREFLGLFQNAAFVCTDSFHGTVFSINFNRDFCCFETAAKNGPKVNSRLHNILGKLNLKHRSFTLTSGMETFNKNINGIAESINYKEVDNLLDEERKMSLKYLEDSLKL